VCPIEGIQIGVYHMIRQRVHDPETGSVAVKVWRPHVAVKDDTKSVIEAVFASVMVGMSLRRGDTNRAYDCWFELGHLCDHIGGGQRAQGRVRPPCRYPSTPAQTVNEFRGLGDIRV
jgi:hypothetical protein